MSPEYTSPLNVGEIGSRSNFNKLLLLFVLGTKKLPVASCVHMPRFSITWSMRFVNIIQPNYNVNKSFTTYTIY